MKIHSLLKRTAVGVKKRIARLSGVSAHKGLTFVSFEDALTLTNEIVCQFPRNVDMVVGVPRSGLLFANIIAQKTGLPLATPDTIAQPWQSKHIAQSNTYGRILLVDDSYRTGAAMNTELVRLVAAGIPRDAIVTASVIVSDEGAAAVDHYAVCIDGPRVFEWNMLHKKMKLATDFDGVLCENPPASVRHDDVAYEHWLNDARPYLIPTFEIDTIITARLERYRSVTEAWLRKHKVSYRHLVMSDATSRQTQRERGSVHKIVALRNNPPVMYWESSIREATAVSQKVSVPVLCTDEMKLV